MGIPAGRLLTNTEETALMAGGPAAAISGRVPLGPMAVTGHTWARLLQLHSVGRGTLGDVMQVLIGVTDVVPRTFL